MTVCPFCKKAVVNPNGGPCPSCGKVDPRGAQAAPAARAAPAGGDDEWDAIERGSGGGGSSGPSSYGGGNFGGLGEDDDGPGISLELDAPVRSHPPAQPPPQSIPPASRSGGHMAHRPNEQMPQPMPARSTPQMAQQSGHNLGPPPSQPAFQQPQHAPPGVAFAPALAPPGGPPDAATMIARYPLPPEKVWQTPVYAMKVLWRQFELRQDIASLRKRRSPDVSLYEQALKTHDGTNFAIGLAITCAAFMVATFIFFLPVILRFVRDPE